VRVSAGYQAASDLLFVARVSWAICAVSRSKPLLNSAFTLSGLIFFGKWIERNIIPVLNSQM
jgi:hypothetical protein